MKPRLCARYALLVASMRMKECDVCVCEVLPFTYLSLLCTCWCVVVVNDKYDM